jgi:hypothetical protein
LGSEFVVNELDVPEDAGDEPMEDMPLIPPRIPLRCPEVSGKQAA